MKTKTYDLNLYVIDGQLRVLAHQLEYTCYGDLTTGTEFTRALTIDLFRGNERQWRPILELFGETQLYSELDSWLMTDVADFNVPHYEFPVDMLKPMPVELAIALEALPEYEIHA